MPQDLEAFGRVLGDDLELPAAVEGRVEVYEPPVQLRHHGVAQQARPYPLGNVARPVAGPYLQLAPVREPDSRHMRTSLRNGSGVPVEG